jgi:hypothetical protein
VTVELHLPGINAPTAIYFDLPIVYVWWIVVLVIMYFPCRWFAGIKAKHRDVWWLSYL